MISSAKIWREGPLEFPASVMPRWRIGNGLKLAGRCYACSHCRKEMLMYRFAFAALIAAPLTMAAPSFAATDIPLPPFTGISVHGGGHVILVHGAKQRVTLLKGDPKVAQIRVNGNTLELSPC